MTAQPALFPEQPEPIYRLGEELTYRNEEGRLVTTRVIGFKNGMPRFSPEIIATPEPEQ